MAKNIKVFRENLFEYYFLNMFVNVKFFSDMKFEYYCEYYPEILLQVGLKYETKIDRRGHEIFSSFTYVGFVFVWCFRCQLKTIIPLSKWCKLL